MEPNQNSSPPGTAGLRPSSMGELVVQNGRLCGARRPIVSPLTLIGQAEQCNIRLNMDGVNPLHCALVDTPAGLLVSDLRSQTGTLVNGEPVTVAVLANGDLLSVGPCRFRVRLPSNSSPSASALPKRTSALLNMPTGHLKHEKEALRIQSAAVAAQQAELMDVESRLVQRQAALEQQEAQLAAHLEEKRRRLVQLRDQFQATRTSLLVEKTAFDRHTSSERNDLDIIRSQVVESQQQSQVERRRLLKLRQRMKYRWHRHWLAERAALQQREDVVIEKQLVLRREKEVLDKQRLRLNGDFELTRRQLQAGWQDLFSEQRKWEETRKCQQDRLVAETALLDDRDRKLVSAQQDLDNQKRDWQRHLPQLEKEAQGLESRILSYREKLFQHQKELTSVATPPRALGEPNPHSTSQLDTLIGQSLPGDPNEAVGSKNIIVVPQSRLQTREVLLTALAGEIADQRWQLAEEVARFLNAKQAWERDRDRVAQGLDALAQQLQERTQTLEQDYEQCHKNRTELSHTRRFFESWQAQLVLKTIQWEADRDRLTGELSAREEVVDRRQRIMSALRRKWRQRHARELGLLRTEYAACASLRDNYTSLEGEYRRRLALLQQQQQRLVEQVLAIEQYRQRVLKQAANPAAAAKRFESFRRRWLALAATKERQVVRDRQVLDSKEASLEDRFKELQQFAADLATREIDLVDKEMTWEQAKVNANNQLVKLGQELKIALTQRDVYQHQVAQLNEELDSVVRQLLNNSGAESLSTQAA